MYSYIKGTLTYKHDNQLVIETGGIGYKISTPVTTVEKCGSIGDEIQVYTYLYIRENMMELIGFLSMEELSMFELLITVSGVGPKAALSICSLMSPSKFSLAVITGDSGAIKKAQGIGLKTSQRIILELKDKLKKKHNDIDSNFEGFMDDEDPGTGSKISEAVSALMVLGYSSYESGRAVSAVYSDSLELEEVVKLSLKRLIK